MAWHWIRNSYKLLSVTHSWRTIVGVKFCRKKRSRRDEKNSTKWRWKAQQVETTKKRNTIRAKANRRRKRKLKMYMWSADVQYMHTIHSRNYISREVARSAENLFRQRTTFSFIIVIWMLKSRLPDDNVCTPFNEMATRHFLLRFIFCSKLT